MTVISDRYKRGWRPLCKCMRMCGCMCHRFEGVKHCVPCCGPSTFTHAMICKGEKKDENNDRGSEKSDMG